MQLVYPLSLSPTKACHFYYTFHLTRHLPRLTKWQQLQPSCWEYKLLGLQHIHNLQVHVDITNYQAHKLHKQHDKTVA